MQPPPQNVHAPPLRVFNYSLDWRFLLPITDVGRIYIAVENDADLSQTLEQVGIPISSHFSFSDIKQTDKRNIQSFALPFGLPVRWVSAKQADQIQFYHSIRRFIEPGGYLLIGFNNSWSFPINRQLNYHPSTLHHTAHQLDEAGFKSIKFFGAIPNLNIPEYIFDLNAQAIQFAFHHRFRRKPMVLNILQLLSHVLSWNGISHFLPCYFAVAAIEL